MQLEQVVLPTLATVTLGTALLVPLRDDRRGKRATLFGPTPMRPAFATIDERRDDTTDSSNHSDATDVRVAAAAMEPDSDATQTTEDDSRAIARTNTHFETIARLFSRLVRTSDVRVDDRATDDMTDDEARPTADRDTSNASFVRDHSVADAPHAIETERKATAALTPYVSTEEHPDRKAVDRQTAVCDADNRNAASSATDDRDAAVCGADDRGAAACGPDDRDAAISGTDDGDAGEGNAASAYVRSRIRRAGTSDRDGISDFDRASDRASDRAVEFAGDTDLEGFVTRFKRLLGWAPPLSEAAEGDARTAQALSEHTAADENARVATTSAESPSAADELATQPRLTSVAQRAGAHVEPADEIDAHFASEVARAHERTQRTLGANDVIPQSYPPICGTTPLDLVRDVRDVRDVRASEEREPVASQRADAPSEVVSCEAHVVSAHRPVNERVLPLTRLPLRPQSATITWPATLRTTGDASHALSPPYADRTQRRALLAELGRERPAGAREALCRAYREEDVEGRRLALRALAEFDRDESSHAIFVDALRVGTDDERSIAVDAVARFGDRSALIRALDDRIEAIAAKAALAFVGSSERESYAVALAPYLDRNRIDAILALLAGIIE